MGEGLGERVIAKAISLAITLSPDPSPACGRGEYPALCLTSAYSFFAISSPSSRTPARIRSGGTVTKLRRSVLCSTSFA
jgi:hypothetical protein